MADYNQLNSDQKLWFNIEPLTTGSIIDHYINNGAEHNNDAIKALILLGFQDIADQLSRINMLFKNGKPPADIIEEMSNGIAGLKIMNNFWRKRMKISGPGQMN